MKIICERLIFFIFLTFVVVMPFSIFADQIIMKDGSILKGKVRSVEVDEIIYLPEGEEDEESLQRASVNEIKYDNGTVVKIPDIDKGRVLTEGVPLTDEDDKPPFRIIDEDKTEPALLPFLLRFGIVMNRGSTKVKIYDNLEKEIADGEADFEQYLFKTSYEPVQTAFYITPEIGYFYRKVVVKDYSYSVETVNQGVEGFIPGIVTDTSTGETVPKVSVSSLAYAAVFHSFFLDLKGGANLVFGFKNFQFILNPYLYTSLIELRKSRFEFDQLSKKESFSRPFLFSFFSAYGLGGEAGVYVPPIRCGLKFGVDLRYIPNFEISGRAKFNEVEYNEELGIMDNRENSASYSSIRAVLFTVEFFFFI